ncbi:hypothetical protein [Streptomyces uncialis]|uniref:hypothetical protein n=1 Tax=Streptomyces uncialis TaxID=1048205 RepID=UPI00224DF248|nr:hypothetical protein [Streptomyces uncialis]MCX4665052.1 hypothetical protein [Streptomyces uncialis]
MGKKITITDNLPQDKATWERRIEKRKDVLDEARTDGDAEWAARAAQRLDNALDGYTRDCR